MDAHGDTRLEGLVLEDVDARRREELVAHGLFVLIGAEPRTEWLPNIDHDDHGFLLTGRDVAPDNASPNRPLFPFETSLPGVFAAGDVRHGSVRRVAGAVGEGSVTVGAVHQYLAAQPEMTTG